MPITSNIRILYRVRSLKSFGSAAKCPFEKDYDVRRVQRRPCNGFASATFGERTRTK